MGIKHSGECDIYMCMTCSFHGVQHKHPAYRRTQYPAKSSGLRAGGTSGFKRTYSGEYAAHDISGYTAKAGRQRGGTKASRDAQGPVPRAGSSVLRKRSPLVASARSRVATMVR